MCSSIVIIGRSALSEKTEESARRAEAHFENQLKVSIELGYADDIAHARRNIACAKFNYEGYNNEAMLKANQEMYESRVAEHGEKNDYTICAGNILAMSLQDQNRGGGGSKGTVSQAIGHKQASVRCTPQ